MLKKSLKFVGLLALLCAVVFIRELKNMWRLPVVDGRLYRVRPPRTMPDGGATFEAPSSVCGNTVRAINRYAFRELRATKRITIPASVEEIDATAFSFCHSLEDIVVDPGNSHYVSIDGVVYDKYAHNLVVCPGNRQGPFSIPKSVLWIGKNAFQHYHGAVRASIPDGVVEIGDSAFDGCCHLDPVIPSSVKRIGKFAFAHASLENVKIPEGVKRISYGTFEESELRSVTLSSSVEWLEREAFSRCSKLTSVRIPAGVSHIDDGLSSSGGVFEGCTSLSSVTFDPGGVKGIGGRMFADCTALTAITLPFGVIGIGDEAFLRCRNLTEVNVPETVISIGQCAFCGCVKLRSVSLPQGVVGIGMKAFEGCVGLQSVSIPKSVTEIGRWAFSRCSSLKTVHVAQGDAERVKTQLIQSGLKCDGIQFQVAQ